MAQSEADQIKMFGQTTAQLDTDLEQAFSGTKMYIASILSDAQAVMEMGDTETARQFINKAKYYLFNEMEKEA